MVLKEGEVHFKTLFEDFPDLLVVYLHGERTVATAQMISFDDFLVEKNSARLELTKPSDLPETVVASLVCELAIVSFTLRSSLLITIFHVWTPLGQPATQRPSN